MEGVRSDLGNLLGKCLSHLCCIITMEYYSSIISTTLDVNTAVYIELKKIVYGEKHRNNHVYRIILVM